MRRRFYLLLFLGFITNKIVAQSGDLIVMGASPDLYLVHAVAPKENWYSVGRIYNISPKEIAPFNGLSIDKPLSIGQQIKVPLAPSNFSQNGTKAGDEVYVPVYHIVQDKEWMFRISTNYNKVPVENLEKWNNISKDQARAGMKLIIGYLKVKGDMSSLAAKGVSTVKTGSAPVKSSIPVSTDTQVPVATAPVTTPPIAAPPEKKTEPIATQENKEVAPAEDKTVINPVSTPPASNPVATAVVNNNTSNGAGYFRSQFEGSGKSVSGAAGVFKSTSGWQDGKYYALMNNVAVGTIVKVSNPTNNKTVFAKVLGQLPEMKESVGLTARVSDAAASELGSTASRFSVEVKY
ncbi:MAG: LysM peptidoglycan-binding domain-containing protein [Chitinophagaceae bacterium]